MVTIAYLEEFGLIGIEAANGQQAMSILCSDPDVTFLITDLGLPGMSGHQLIEEALVLKPDLKIVIISGRSPEDIAGWKPLRAEFLPKPFTQAQLLRALKA